MYTRTRLALLPLLASLALAPLAGCDDGGDENNTAPDTTSAPDTTDATGSDDTQPGTDTTGADTRTDVDAPDATAGDTTEPGEDTTDTSDTADATNTEDATDIEDATDVEDTDTEEDVEPFVPGAYVDDCLAAPLPDDLHRATVMHFDGPELRLAILRDIDPDAFGTSGTAIYRARRFALESRDHAVCVDDEDLAYHLSHHNFHDTLHATDAGLVFTLNMNTDGYDSPFVDTLTVRDAEENVLLGPVTLTFVSCTPLDPMGYCQLGRRGD